MPMLSNQLFLFLLKENLTFPQQNPNSRNNEFSHSESSQLTRGTGSPCQKTERVL